MKPLSPRRRIEALVALAVLAAGGVSAWTYVQTQPRPLVNRSALRNYKAAIAEKAPAARPAPRHIKGSGGYVAWKALAPEQQAVLAPLEKRWDYLSAHQRKSLIEAARRYPKMTGEQKIDFGARLVQWSQLTGKQRKEIREHYKQLAALSPERRAELKETWLDEHEEPEAAPDSAIVKETESTLNAGQR